MLDVITALAEVLVDARNRAERSTAAVADAAGVSQRTVERWEKESSFPWKKDLPKAVAAYSSVSGIAEADLWRKAVDKASRRVEVELKKGARDEGEDESLRHLENEVAGEMDTGADEAAQRQR